MLKDFGFADALRFAFAGVILYTCLYIYKPDTAKDFAETLGPVGFPFGLIALSSVIYFIYRPLIYDPGIERLHVMWRKHRPNYRQFLVKEYRLSFHDASQLFAEIRDQHLKDRYSTNLRNWAAGIHMTYLTSLVTIIFFVLAAIGGEGKKAAFFGIVAILSFAAAFINDRSYEETEYKMLLGLGKEKRDAIATALGHNRDA